MTIYGDPNIFALLIEAIPQWTSHGGHVNGAFHFIVDQQIFPKTMRVSTISADVGSLWTGNALRDLPEDGELAAAPAGAAFHRLLGRMLPALVMHEDDLPDDFVADYTHQASTHNLEDCGCFAFAVAVDQRVRILAAEVDGVSARHRDSIAAGVWPDVAEAWVDRKELVEILEAVRLRLWQPLSSDGERGPTHRHPL